MLQGFLKDSFGLVFHMSKKGIDAYTLVVAKGGPKLQPAAPAAGPPPEHLGPQARFQTDDKGFPALPAGYSISATTGSTTTTGAVRMTFRNAAPAVLVTAIGKGTLKISDKTGLSGPYDFTLEFDPESLIPLIPSTLHLPDLPEYRPNAPDISPPSKSSWA
jgi:uncharacterized protein (TIGR03435 family)